MKNSESRFSSAGNAPLERADRRDAIASLGEILEAQYPEWCRQTAAETEQRGAAVRAIEERIADREIADLLRAYALDDADVREMPDGRYEIPVTSHPEGYRRLPEGYAYKGGAARTLLLRNLGMERNTSPRDLDVVRLTPEEPELGDDARIARLFMPEDAAHGNGVEAPSDLDEYFSTRDLTLNEVLATEDRVIATRECLLDTIRRIIRQTDFSREQFEALEQGTLAKIIRFYAEAIERWDHADIEQNVVWEIERYFIAPFWLALNLDRAYERGSAVAERYVSELVARGQLPREADSVPVAAQYLTDLMGERPFHYRHAPTHDFETEEEWAGVEHDLSTRRSRWRGY